MTTIRILPEILSNQIAAGEVIQRPSFVVKELVENSIDAGATHITVEVVRGGKSSIRISDNGIGLSRDDALLSIERYATSKLSVKEDLFSIATMGFRGEALPSIASISKFSLVTRTKDTDIGTKIDIIGGKIQNVSDIGAPVGTMVEVKALFFNTPARRKFLKSDPTETSHVADVISGMALGHSHIQFRLFLNHKLTKNFSLSDNLFQRSLRILGRDVADKLYALEFSDAFIHIYGYCANPSAIRSTSSKIFLFVNKRLVYDRGLISAIFHGYKGRIMKRKYPMGVFFMDIDFDQVDVNVHPSKRTVRFFNAQRVYQSVSRAVENTLTREQQDMAAYSKRDPDLDDKFEYRVPMAEPGRPDQFNRQDKIEQSTFNWPETPYESKREIVREPSKNNSSLRPLASKLKIMGQVMGTYILAEGEGELVLIDQHAAHERIVYEALKKRYHSLTVQSQSLAMPEILELNFREADFLSAILDELKRLGMIIDPFGETTFVIKAVPSVIDEKEIKPIILEIIETGLVKKDRSSTADWLEKCLILMACHTAIRANVKLENVEIQKLLADLENCENPRHCPHGRPIVITWSKHRIEKLFKRVV